jgi:N-glycosylase/DNA lyase
VRDYDLGATLNSGQAFRWESAGSGWEGVVAGRWVYLEGRLDGVRARVVKDPGDWEWLVRYLQLEVDMDRVMASFPKDPVLQAAVQRHRGLRLLRQDPWECLASFVLSSTKQIVQIRQMVREVCLRFGEPVQVPSGHRPVWAFPGSKVIAEQSEQELRECRMGFRAKYLRGTAQAVARGQVDLGALSGSSLEQARAALMTLPGVGRKIADCVLLFGLGFDQAFPVDVWVMRALREGYFAGEQVSTPRLLAWVEDRFGPWAGYAQQYLFHRARLAGRRGPG